MSDTDPTSVDPTPVDPTESAAAAAAGGAAAGGAAAGGPPDDGGTGDEDEAKPWYKNPAIIAAIVVAILALIGLGIWAGSSEDKETAGVGDLTTEELIELCIAQNGSKSDEACAELALTLTDQEKADLTAGCSAGDPEACRLLELIGEPVPAPTTTTTAASSGDTIIVVPPPAPDEPTPPDPTIPDLPDPTLDELIEACLAEDGQTSQDACDYLAENLTDSQIAAIQALCDQGDEDACKLLELIGVTETPTTSTTAEAAAEPDAEADGEG